MSNGTRRLEPSFIQPSVPELVPGSNELYSRLADKGQMLTFYMQERYDAIPLFALLCASHIGG